MQSLITEAARWWLVRNGWSVSRQRPPDLIKQINDRLVEAENLFAKHIITAAEFVETKKKLLQRLSDLK